MNMHMSGQRVHDQVLVLRQVTGSGFLTDKAYRLTNFPMLLTIALYERQAKKIGTVGVGETLMATAEQFVETLPRNIKRWSVSLVYPSCKMVLNRIRHSSPGELYSRGGIRHRCGACTSLSTRTANGRFLSSDIRTRGATRQRIGYTRPGCTSSVRALTKRSR